MLEAALLLVLRPINHETTSETDTGKVIAFGKLGRRIVSADFNGGELGSDAKLLLLRKADERIGLTRAVAAVFADRRDASRIQHPLRNLLAQRIYALCCGYEDLNDHTRLRHDVLMQTAVGQCMALGARQRYVDWRTRLTWAPVAALHEVLVTQFLAAYHSAPAELVLDLDASDIPLHGAQEKIEFPGYYDHHCY